MYVDWLIWHYTRMKKARQNMLVFEFKPATDHGHDTSDYGNARYPENIPNVINISPIVELMIR